MLRRRFALEPLEDRRLLAVDTTVLGMPMSTFVGPFAMNGDGQLVPPGAYVSSVSPRQLPAAELINLSLPPTSVQPGETDIVMSNLLSWSPPGSYAKLGALIAVPAEDSVPFEGNVNLFSLWGDLDGRASNGYETLLDTAEPSGDVVILENFSRGVFVGRGHYPTFQIRADVSDSLFGDFLGVEVATAEFSNLRGKPFADHRISYVGEPTLFPIKTVSGELSIAERPQGTFDTAVANEKNVPLLRFDAIASGADVLVTDFSFVAEQGNLNSATNYSFWVDTNGDGSVDTVLQHGVAAQQGRVTFSSLANGGYVVPQGKQLTSFEVHGDIASSPASSTLQLDFAATDAVMAELTANGNSLNADDIHLDASAESTVYTIVTVGDLYVIRSATQTPANELLGGTSREGLRLTLRAGNEEIIPTYLGFAVTSLTNVDSLELYMPGATTPFAVATRSGAQGTDSLGAPLTDAQLMVPVSGEDVIVRVRTKTDEQGSVSGALVQVSLTTVQARGANSSNTLHSNDGDAVAEGEVFIGTATPGANQAVSGPSQAVTHSEVAVITNVNPDSDGTSIPVSSDVPLGQFRFTAAPHMNTRNGSNDVVLDSVQFLVSANNVALATNGFSLFNKANSTVRSTTYTLDPVEGQSVTGPTVSGLFRVTFTNLDTHSVNTGIDVGSDITLVLGVNVVNPKVTNTSSSLFAGVKPGSTSWIDRDASESVYFNSILYPEYVVWSTYYTV